MSADLAVPAGTYLDWSGWLACPQCTKGKAPGKIGETSSKQCGQEDMCSGEPALTDPERRLGRLKGNTEKGVAFSISRTMQLEQEWGRRAELRTQPAEPSWSIVTRVSHDQITPCMPREISNSRPWGSVGHSSKPLKPRTSRVYIPNGGRK